VSPPLESAWQALESLKFGDEDTLVEELLRSSGLSTAQRREIERSAVALVEEVRRRKSEHSLLDTFLKQYGLDRDEGVALMCLAEALLRIPDADTADALIADKIVPARWSERLGDSDSLFVNASTWGLMLTGRVIAMESSIEAGEWLSRLVGRLGEPVIRTALRQAMGLLGREFVLGRTIREALARARREEFECASYDMLGEGARTAADAERHLNLYEAAIREVAAARGGATIMPGVSVKLSALHPRYEYAQHQRVQGELYPRLKLLAEAASNAGVQLTVDAEEADRMALALELFERLAREPALRGTTSIGMVVQTYDKRAPAAIDLLLALAQETGASFPVRLVKGAYWDAEIKHAQVAGLPDFPVFTRKNNTDVSYLVCAERLFAAAGRLAPQFATHNAHSLAAVMHMSAGRDVDFEFQRLHGMGELLYRVAATRFERFPRLRVYAPVGGHEDLLPYLVRRLLENGANSSFVNRFLDEKTPAEAVVPDPFRLCAQQPRHRQGRIRLPAELFGDERANSPGLDLAGAPDALALIGALEGRRGTRYDDPAGADPVAVRNPCRPDEIVGTVSWSTAAAIDTAFRTAEAARAGWDALGAAARAARLRALADLLLARRYDLMDLLVREGGRSLVDGDAEIREAVDFCRYYAGQAEKLMQTPVTLPGPTGELNQLGYRPRGVFVCISPWNFPLAIFLGQITAALAVGNPVIAKPAEQTPLIGRYVAGLIHEAGVPDGAFQLVQGDGAIGSALVSDPRCAGVVFTGGSDTAKKIQQALAARPGEIVPLIAETGGMNAMLVDSSALLEQVTDDVLTSAFRSAGQRCSALRVLFLQEDIAERAIEMLLGAMAELRLGDPGELATDVGPVIDAEAKRALEAHVAEMRAAGLEVHQPTAVPRDLNGHFVAPCVVELDRFDRLTREHFGPILHVVRFDSDTLEDVLAAVAATGYGLTLGLHSRIERHQRLAAAAPVGNVYVNRNIIGAVVGVQPFGGRGLSGTGPKAGGPDYLRKFAWEQTVTINTTAQGGNVELLRGTGDPGA